MKTARSIKSIIIAAAIASTMALAIGSSTFGLGSRTAGSGLADRPGLLQIADKGSDGQETHG